MAFSILYLSLITLSIASCTIGACSSADGRVAVALLVGIAYLKPHLPQKDLPGLRRAWQRGHSSWKAAIVAGWITGAGGDGTVLTGGMTMVLSTAPQFSQTSSAGLTGEWHTGQ